MDISKNVRFIGRHTHKKLDHPLAYPEHSLLVYAPDSSPESPPKWGSDERRYHYKCPRGWLATSTKEVRLVVLVTRGTEEVIGRYEPSGRTAYATTWNVVFIDLATHCIVAWNEINMTDPSSPGILTEGHWSLPTAGAVISTIESDVSFTN